MSSREEQGGEFYAGSRGRPGVPLAVYFRMLMVGYQEGLGSERGIAWRCADSFSLREFLGCGVTGNPPEHSTLSKTRKRLSVEAHGAIFAFVLERLKESGLLSGRTLGVDATTLEANAGHALDRAAGRRDGVRRVSGAAGGGLGDRDADASGGAASGSRAPCRAWRGLRPSSRPTPRTPLRLFFAVPQPYCALMRAISAAHAGNSGRRRPRPAFPHNLGHLCPASAMHKRLSPRTRLSTGCLSEVLRP